MSLPGRMRPQKAITGASAGMPSRALVSALVSASYRKAWVSAPRVEWVMRPYGTPSSLCSTASLSGIRGM